MKNNPSSPDEKETAQGPSGPMPRLGLKTLLLSLVLLYGSDAWNWYRNADGINPHRSYGYMICPQVAQLVVDWWRG